MTRLSHVSSILEEIKAASSAWVDKVRGGRADKKRPSDFDAIQLADGIRVEVEHTDDVMLAMEIAMDHLVEDPHYYKKLKKIHKESDDLTKHHSIGGWHRPDIDSDGPHGEFNEVADRAKDLGIPHAHLANAIRTGQIAPLSHEHWSQLQNTDSWKTDTHDKAKKRAEHYGRDYHRVVSQIKAGKAAAPMVLHRPGKPPYLIGGNTRLMAARAMGVTPHVVHAFLHKT